MNRQETAIGSGSRLMASVVLNEPSLGLSPVLAYLLGEYGRVSSSEPRRGQDERSFIARVEA